jgi:hypothetical protein
MPAKIKAKRDDQILEEFRKRFSEAGELWDPIHTDFRNYYRFSVAVDGQWNPQEKARMGDPALQTNRVLAYGNQVINTAIQQEIGCLVEPVSEGATAQLGLVRQSQIMTLWRKGDGSVASGYALRGQIFGSYGVLTQEIAFADRSGFNKTIKWHALEDPTMFRCDPAARGPALSDMTYSIIEHDLSKAGFRKRWGAIQKLSRIKDENFYEGGNGKQKVFEYWCLHEGSYEEVADTNGKTYRREEYMALDAATRPELATLVTGDEVTRRVSDNQVIQYIIGNDRVLKRIPWPGSRIPQKVIEGRIYWESNKKSYQAMTTHAMNPQKKYNFIESQKALMFSKGPQEIVFAPAETTVADVQKKLNDVSRNGSQGITVIPYKAIGPNGEVLGAPTFKAQLLGDPVLTQESQLAINDIEACFGMSPLSWMNPNPTASGVAMERRETQGQTSNFDFVKNWLVGLEESFRDTLEIIPKLGIAMQIKLAGPDQKERTVWVGRGAPAADGTPNFDLDEDEEYALVLRVTPSEKHQRELAFDQLMMMVQRFPNLAVAIPDLAIKAGTNNQYTETMAARAERMVPPAILGEQQMDPQVALMGAQLEQAGSVIQGLQQQLQSAVQALRSLQEQLKLEKASNANDLVIAAMEDRIKKMELGIDEQKLRVEQYKATTERLAAEAERLKLATSPHAALFPGAPAPGAAPQAGQPT